MKPSLMEFVGFAAGRGEYVVDHDLPLEPARVKIGREGGTLLVLRILPLKVFNHSSLKDLYGGLLNEAFSGENQDQGRISTITGLLLESESFSGTGEPELLMMLPLRLPSNASRDTILPSPHWPEQIVAVKTCPTSQRRFFAAQMR
uniref:Uncharacterized protein n=1 Tax=Physcomitrium patens TaxID=3218 RepID=A0A2K1IXV3_PHYPA|nr:hypothetical protein PHYPA_023913 [Physcomitrium patens]